MKKADCIIIIPSRIASTRLERKPLKKIGDKTVIEWVAKQAIDVAICDVIVACCCNEIAEVLEKSNIKYILTDPNVPSGSDRVYTAYKLLEGDYKYIINLQGDMPFIKKDTIKMVYNTIKQEVADIATVAVPIKNTKKLEALSTVEAITSYSGRALYFTRYYDERKKGELLEHIGIYGYTVNSLEKFASLSESPLEKLEKLEQLRALENGMSIQVAKVQDPHISVDTTEDLRNAREYYDKYIK